MIKQAEKSYEPRMLERKIQEFWIRTKAYQKTKDKRSDGEDFYFIDGPPYTTGSIHPGTGWNKAIKDCILRYLRMHGYNIRDQAGFDMHGLPIEVQVEKSLGIGNKKEIEELGIEKFISTCKDFATSFQKKMTEQFKALGVWLDWDKPYLTITNNYILSAWWTLKVAYEKDLLSLSNRVLQWCPRCETALAEAEIEYWDVTDPSIFVKFLIRGRRDEYILIWTTTPWTIPSNLAVAVHPDFTYARVRIQKAGKREVYIMLEEKAEEISKKVHADKFEILETMKGEKLAGLQYFNPLMPMVPYQKTIKAEWVHRVLTSTTVTEENTGCVHIAPGHGPEDFEIGQVYHVPPFCPVDERGIFTEDGGVYKSQSVKDSNPRIIEDLKKMRALCHEEKITHRYGHCWRCKTPIIYRVTEQWFLKATDLKEVMLSEVERVEWTPDWAGSARQHEWVANVKDWCISRQRYWGIPLPIWKCDCGEIKIVGAMKDFEGAENYVKDMDLHRPHIDNVTFKCQKCEGTMRRIEDVLDVWFDSAVCSWAQLNYPMDQEEFKRWWPCKWITEACDQTRGWFYSQLGAGVIAFDKCPYDSVLMHGWMNDSKGQSMSKSAGNFIEMEDVLEEHGADALRFYFLKINAPWEDINFIMEDVKNAKRSLNILWNVFVFASMYMAIDKFNPEKASLSSLSKTLKPEDKWLLSRLEGLKIVVEEEMKQYNLHKAARELENFILEDLSRWYIKLIRNRMWTEGADESKTAAYKVLHESLVTLAQLMAPITPFISEAIYQNLDGRLLSVHMCDWLEASESFVSPKLEKDMDLVRMIVEEVSKARQSKGIKLRWPVKEIVVKCNDEESADGLRSFEHILLDKLNTKKLDILSPKEEWEGLKLEVKPNPEAIGKVYRQWASRIAVILESRPPETIKEEIDKGAYQLGIDGQMIKIQPNMVKFNKKFPENFLAIERDYGGIYIDLETSPEIVAEGFAREVVRRIQEMRKEVDMEVEDYLKTQIKAPKKILEFLGKWEDFISFETRSRSLKFAEDEVNEEYIVEWDIEKESVTIGITPLYMKEAVDVFTQIPGVDSKKAISLFEKGYNALDRLSEASNEDLLEVDGIGEVDVRRIKEFIEKPVAQREKEKMHCPFCGVEITPRVVKCPRCSELVREDMRICGSCGKEISIKAERCYYCGALPEEERVEEIAPPAVVEPTATLEGTPAGEIEVAEPPKPEEKLLPEMKESYTYLIKELRSRNSYRLFINGISKGKRGMCITRVYPGKVRGEHNIDVPILWLSNVDRENCVRPKDLEKLNYSVNHFIREGNAVVLLEGLEYLITNNNFIIVLRLIQSLKDEVAMQHAILLLPLNPTSLDHHQMSLIEKEVDETIDIGS